MYQYTSFALWRSKVSNKSEDEKIVLAESGHVRLSQLTNTMRKLTGL